MTGFLLINKPADVTSFRCVGIIKRLVGKGVRVGHAGTLDRFATGLLVIGIGRDATKHLGLLLNMPKTYIGTGKLGELTDTLDPMGEVIKICDKAVSLIDLQKALDTFGSGYLQTPPVYSALKFAGQRLSDLHRANRDLNNLSAEIDVHQIARDKSRYINLYRLELKDFNDRLFTIEANVSSGTYIRVLMNDIANQIDSCATTVQLCRTKIGPFSLDQSLELNELNLDKIMQSLICVNDLHDQINSSRLNI